MKPYVIISVFLAGVCHFLPSWAETQQTELIAYHQAIQANPKNATAYFNRGRVYEYLKDYDKALSDYSQAIALNQEDDWSYAARATLYQALKQYENALADYTKIIQINPKSSWAYYLRGKTYDDLKQYDKALADYTQALQLSPKFVEAAERHAFVSKMLTQSDKVKEKRAKTPF